MVVEFVNSCEYMVHMLAKICRSKKKNSYESCFYEAKLEFIKETVLI